MYFIIRAGYNQGMSEQPTYVPPVNTPPQPAQQAQAVPAAHTNNTMALLSMILGIVSILGFGLLLGIPAIVLGIIALKKRQGEKGFSITGIVTGGIATLVSLLFLLFWVFVLVIFTSASSHSPSHDTSSSQRQL
jgi:hypothetical protein